MRPRGSDRPSDPLQGDQSIGNEERKDRRSNPGEDSGQEQKQCVVFERHLGYATEFTVARQTTAGSEPVTTRRSW
jgi:hypothetical protein